MQDRLYTASSMIVKRKMTYSTPLSAETLRRQAVHVEFQRYYQTTGIYFSCCSSHWILDYIPRKIVFWSNRKIYPDSFTTGWLISMIFSIMIFAWKIPQVYVLQFLSV